MIPAGIERGSLGTESIGSPLFWSIQLAPKYIFDNKKNHKVKKPQNALRHFFAQKEASKPILYEPKPLKPNKEKTIKKRKYGYTEIKLIKLLPT